LVDHASLCLYGKAAEQWALIRKSWVLHGKDVKDFDLFKAEMLANYVDMFVEGTVRFRLAQLKQVDTVAQSYSQLRAIAVEAVTYPVTAPEACAAFRAGLKPQILELLMKDSSVRHEMSNVELVVKAAKEAEALLAMLAGVSKGKGPAGEHEGGDPPRDRGVKRPANGPPAKGGGKDGGKDFSKMQKKYRKGPEKRTGSSSTECYHRHQFGHFSWDCPTKREQGGKKKSSGQGPSTA
jgi:Retrotransposon gag protein